MSYNGVITISPSAARADMNKLSSAIEQLEQSRTAIVQLQPAPPLLKKPGN